MQTIFQEQFYLMALDKKKRTSNMLSKMAVKVEMLYTHHL